MIEILESINCKNILNYNKSNRAEKFDYIKCIFNYNSNVLDRNTLDFIISQGVKLAAKVFGGAANNSDLSRSKQRIINNCIAGLIAEHCWEKVLNKELKIVQETVFLNASNQIDLEIIKSKKKIEVRSSFPRNGVEFAICHPIYEFDVIGPYANGYKPSEIQKDYYVRTLFPFTSDLINDKIKSDNFTVFLTGGATWEMMCDDNYSKIKSLIPEDEINVARLLSKSNYRVVPFSKSLDTINICKLIKK
jgi:hypothetical protein